MLAPFGFAVLFYFLPLSPELLIVIFAILLFMWSVTFPHLQHEKKPLPQSAVDFWYYALAMVGVVLFFFVNNAERLKLDAKDTIASTPSEISSVRARKKLLLEIQMEEQKRSSQIGQREADIVSQVKRFASERSARNEKLLEECGANMIGWRLEEIQERLSNTDRPWHTRPEVRINVQKAMCESVALDYFWGEFQAVANSKALFELVRKHNVGDTFKVEVDGGQINVGTAAKYVAEPFDPAAAERETAKLDARITAAEEKEALARAVLKPTEESPDVTLRDQFAKIGYFFWPYLLITALGMKIARRPYSVKIVP